METWKYEDMDMETSNEKQNPWQFSLICLPFAHCASEFCCLSICWRRNIRKLSVCKQTKQSFLPMQIKLMDMSAEPFTICRVEQIKFSFLPETHTYCSGLWKPGSRCRLSKAHNWFGETPGGREFGIGREWGGNGEGEVSLRATWDQGGRDRITPKEGFQVSKREMEGGVTKN